jgi:hypothetical protein
MPASWLQFRYSEALSLPHDHVATAGLDLDGIRRAVCPRTLAGSGSGCAGAFLCVCGDAEVFYKAFTSSGRLMSCSIGNVFICFHVPAIDELS